MIAEQELKMSTVTQNPGAYPLAELSHQLNEEWKKALVCSDGTLNKAGLKRNIEANKKIPHGFLQGFKAKYPEFRLPQLNPDATPEASIPVAALPSDDERSSSGGKRKFSWLIHEWVGNTDELNAREADGTLKPLKECTGSVQENGPGIDVPEGLMTNEMREFWNAMYEINAKPYYDPEELALGSLEKSEYMIVPSNWPVHECPIVSIGAGSDVYTVPTPTNAAVYALAKEQAKDLKFSDDDQIKWALLRLEAFKSGWFAHQKYTMFKPAPNGSNKIMLNDEKKIRELSAHVHALCSFLPFMNEYHFRAFGASYNKANSADYLKRAQDFAASASLSHCLTYMDPDILHRKVLAWIGVKRPMQVLRNTTAITRVPNPFRSRAFASPAGQAIISTSIAVINSIKAAGWWDVIKQKGGYDDSTLISVGAEIARNPWKFHPMCHVYGEEPPDADEAKQVEEAKRSGILFAPILQAYAETVMKDTPLGRIKALKKHADANPVQFMAARKLFVKAAKNPSVVFQ